MRNLERNAFIFSIIKQDIRIYVAYSRGQTAGPIGLKFFVDTQGLPGGVLGYKNSNIFSKTF